VNCETTAEWLSTEEYPDSDILDADETGLFFRLTPKRTLKFKREECVGGKLSEDRVTVLVCANAGGTKKRKLFVIGKSKNPRCLKNVKKHASSVQRKQKILDDLRFVRSRAATLGSGTATEKI
jgi:hypothetical protein